MSKTMGAREYTVLLLRSSDARCTAALEVNKIVIWLRLCTNYNTHCREQHGKKEEKRKKKETKTKKISTPNNMTIEKHGQTHIVPMRKHCFNKKGKK